MSYIRIANKAEGVNRLFLEKLGLSTKRDDENTIGCFGSGSKFAPIAALRNGWEWINVGEDDLGQYKMQYVSQEESGIDCIFYLYDDEILKPSSFTVDAGLLSWENEFQIFREAFSNALDEFTSNGSEYSIEVVDEVKFEPGIFAVYLTADHRLLDIVNNFGKYFNINRDAICEVDSKNKIFASFDNEANIYFKGVLVHSDVANNAIPIFDYQFSDITLNEERRVRNTSDVSYKVISILDRLRGDDPIHVDIARTLIDNMNLIRWEWTLAGYTVDSYFYGTSSFVNGNAFRVAWDQIYWGKVAASSELMKYKSHFALRDCEVVEVKSEFLYKILGKSGVKTAESVLGDDIEYNFVKLSGVNEKLFDIGINIVKQYIPKFEEYVSEVKVFIPQGEQDRILGSAHMDTNSIYISINAISDMKTLVGTLIHEYDHIYHGVSDEDLKFRSIADDHIGHLLMEVYGGKV